jgi:hypothetical protein
MRINKDSITRQLSLGPSLCIFCALLFHEFLKLHCVPMVYRCFRVVQLAIIDHQLNIVEKKFQRRVLIRVQFMLHRAEI